MTRFTGTSTFIRFFTVAGVFAHPINRLVGDASRAVKRAARNSGANRGFRTHSATKSAVCQVSRLAPGTHSTSVAPLSFKWRAKTNKWSDSRLM